MELFFFKIASIFVSTIQYTITYSMPDKIWRCLLFTYIRDLGFDPLDDGKKMSDFDFDSTTFEENENWRPLDATQCSATPKIKMTNRHTVLENHRKKISFNIASEASYVYILSGQKLIKNAKNGPFWWVFENLKLAVKQCYQTCQF